MIFAIISAFIFLTIAFVIKKRIYVVELYTTSLFAMVFQLLVDNILEFKYDFYGYFEKGVDYETFIVILLIYPPLNIIFLNYFPLNKKLLTKCLYILGWCVFSVLYEYLSVKIGFFYYEKWSIWYSAIIYPFVYGLLLVNFFSIRKLLHLYKHNNV
ncbi:CBO0543 family protein [Ornithinibacillus halotolerans]|uniref:CBO0543 family protein n=1 Tax=Ornithinibacillus halotolerans TaxID=1274357 RepID=UPI0016638FA0|nr:CBO0543 family protein [Ornithinibacillus halotolerans]